MQKIIYHLHVILRYSYHLHVILHFHTYLIAGMWVYGCAIGYLVCCGI